MKSHLALIFTGVGLLVPVTALAKRDLNQGGTLLGQKIINCNIDRVG
jgi:hypothetical protein